MSFVEDCNYRESIMNKIYRGERITDGERLWLRTNPVYNRRYQDPCYNIDIIRLEANVKYCINISVERITCDEKMSPIVGVAAGKGKITIDGELLDLDGNVTTATETKILGVNIDSNNAKANFNFSSNLGLLSVAYRCEYFSKNMGMYRQDSSSAGFLNLAMKKVVLAENKVEYHCKSALNENFDSYVFVLEWVSKARTM